MINTQDVSSKKINIEGKYNRYKMKKVTHQKEELKKRIESEKWDLPEEYYKPEMQLLFMHKIIQTNLYKSEVEDKCDTDAYEDKNVNSLEVLKILTQQIHKKIYGYKQQDTLKKILDEHKFITFDNIVHKLIECKLNCYYCKASMMILYDISREMTQWSVDRIDNDLGHNVDNYHLSCLDCNLKRKRRTDEKFLFTKQLHLIKHETN